VGVTEDEEFIGENFMKILFWKPLLGNWNKKWVYKHIERYDKKNNTEDLIMVLDEVTQQIKTWKDMNLQAYDNFRPMVIIIHNGRNLGNNYWIRPNPERPNWWLKILSNVIQRILWQWMRNE
jgi:hypothetical protein